MGTHRGTVQRSALSHDSGANVARVKRLVALLVPAVLVLAACGGDDDAATTTAPTPLATDAGEADGASDADEGADEAGSSSDYCRLFREFEEEDPFDTFDDDSDFGGFREAFGQAQVLLDRIQAIAPAEIRDDFATIAEGFGQLADALEDVDYNLFELDESVFEGFDERFEEAGDRIDEYNERVCGISSDDFDDEPAISVDPDAAFDENSVRDLVAQQLAAIGLSSEQAACVAGKLDLEGIAASGDDVDPMAFFELFDECGVDFSTLGQG